MLFSKEFFEVYIAKVNNSTAAYLLYNPSSKRIHQIGVDESFRNQGVAKLLVSYLFKMHPYIYTIINVDKNDTVSNKVLQNLGFENLVALDELVFKLA